MRHHTVVIGYGTKGRAAVAAMVGAEVAPADIVVVDENATALERAKSAGFGHRAPMTPPNPTSSSLPVPSTPRPSSSPPTTMPGRYW